MAFSFPTLPALYFLPSTFEDQVDSTALADDDNGKSKTQQANAFHEFPPEILQLCLVDFASWGDLAKLACVQRSWSTLVPDAASIGQEAMWDLAQALLNGTSGLKPNPSLAMQYLVQLSNMELDKETQFPVAKKANIEAEHFAKPFAPAMRAIANCYLTGSGVEQSSDKGMAWLKATHLEGHDNDAAYECAHIYEHGKHGTEVDVYAAFEWFEKAAEAGHVEAMAELALCYELGCGVQQSDEKALDWYMKAARLGHATAKYSVGEAFEEARGVPQSDEEACLWYYQAAQDGDEDGRLALIRLQAIARIVVPGVGRLIDV